MRRTLMLTAALILATPTQTAEAAWNHPLPRAWYEALARCETGNNPAHSTRSYVGAFGFYRRTWDLFADTPNRRAPQLSFAAQARVLDRAFWWGHTENGRRQYPVGPWGHGCFKKLEHTQQAVCKHKNHKIRRWCR